MCWPCMEIECFPLEMLLRTQSILAEDVAQYLGIRFQCIVKPIAKKFVLNTVIGWPIKLNKTLFFVNKSRV